MGELLGKVLEGSGLVRTSVILDEFLFQRSSPTYHLLCVLLILPYDSYQVSPLLSIISHKEFFQQLLWEAELGNQAGPEVPAVWP